MTSKIIDWENELKIKIHNNVDSIVSYLPNDYTFIDIGANTGLLTQMVIEKKDDFKSIHMFEPVKEYYEECVTKFGNDDRIIINNFGLSDKAESVKIKLDTYNLGFNQISENGSECIELNQFDLYAALHNITHADFIKIDTEGWDIKVMYGMDKWLKGLKQLPYIYFEKGWDLEAESNHCQYMIDTYGYERVIEYDYDYLLIK